MKPKKVLMFAGPIHPIPPIKGAAVETWIYEVCKRLKDIEPHIVSMSHPKYPIYENINGVHFHRLKFGKAYTRIKKITGLDPFSYPKRIIKIIEKIKPDIVHMHNSIKWFVPIIDYLKNSSIKTVLHMHNESQVKKKIKVDHLLGCSGYITDFYKDKILADTYTPIFNGVDEKRFLPFLNVPKKRAEIRKKYKIKKDDIIILFVGRVSIEKGVEHFIDSACRLKELEKIKFFIIGEIRKEDKKNDRVMYANKMIEKAKGLNEKITFTDVFSPDDINSLYLLGNIVVIPSNFEEPFSMVAIEAMATGIPIIARKKGGMKEYIRQSENGLFITEKNISKSICENIKLLINNKNLYKKISNEGRKTIENMFTWEIISSNVEKFYNNILSL